jgi:hypothetical protein
MDTERRRFLFLKVIARFSVCGDFLSVLFTVFAGIPSRITYKDKIRNSSWSSTLTVVFKLRFH